MAKPTPKRITSDECAVLIDGETYYPHEGEWVELISDGTVGEVQMRVRFSNLAVDLDAAQSGDDVGRRVNEVWDRYYTDLCDCLAERIFAWNWTDLKGRPLPPPADEDGKPLGLLKLRGQELYWLLNATVPVETESDRKND